MQTITPLPSVHTTNYQQHIDTAILTQGIADHIPADAKLPENIHVSIAYMQVQRHVGIFKTTLVLSIKGKAYRFSFNHNNRDYYIAKYSLDLNTYGTQIAKDNHIRLFQAAFEDVVVKNIKQITKAITTAYELR